jgi:PAS domain S-box-containing protein
MQENPKMTNTAPPKMNPFNPWHFVWISVVFSELFTVALNTLQGFIWFGKVSSELLMIGAIDALFVPLIVAPIIIYFVRHTSELKKTNEQLQQEIVQRKEAELALAQSEAHYRAMIVAFDGLIYICSPDYRIEFMNAQLRERTGYDATGHYCYKALHDLDSICSWCVNDRVVAGNKVQWEVQSPKDGRWYHVSNTPIYNANGSISKQAMIMDITDRIQSEEKIRFLASIIQNMPDAVCAIDSNGVTMTWNTGAERLLGYQAAEIIGKPIVTVIPEEIAQKELEHCLRILNTEGFFSGYESVRLAKDGRRVPVEVTAVAISDKMQKTRNYASIMVDITDRKKAEVERLKSHMLESIGILAGGIAHDFNNLLNVIIGHISVARMYMQSDDKAFSQLVDAEEFCHMASDLSRRLITFATGGDPIRKVMPLSGLLMSMVNTLLHDSNISPEFNLPDDLSPVAIDEGQMKQVVNNLTLNAKEAVPKGGVFAISGENLHITEQDSSPMRAGNYVKISFRDNGTGIPAEDLAKIFDPYYSTKDLFHQKGLGLGLAVCYSIIKRHDGLITVESEYGKGTTFHIYLPAVS